MPKLTQVLLRCTSPDSQRHFYCNVLGMSEFDDGSVGYGGDQATLLFQKGEEKYVSVPTDLYWKIALAVPNIELAWRQLTDQGVEVGEPRQFGDVGYLAHFSDPEGFSIELIEHWFKDNRPALSLDSSLLGGGAHFNLLTLRTVDIAEVERRCLAWGMKRLVVQSLESYGFNLYFYAFTSDTTPSPDVYAIENREWLYQRKYTILEVQHLLNEREIHHRIDSESGYVGTVLSGLESDALANDLGVRLR